VCFITVVEIVRVTTHALSPTPYSSPTVDAQKRINALCLGTCGDITRLKPSDIVPVAAPTVSTSNEIKRINTSIPPHGICRHRRSASRLNAAGYVVLVAASARAHANPFLPHGSINPYRASERGIRAVLFVAVVLFVLAAALAHAVHPYRAMKRGIRAVFFVAVVRFVLAATSRSHVGW
jgi:hypothetical protein